MPCHVPGLLVRQSQGDWFADLDVAHTDTIATHTEPLFLRGIGLENPQTTRLGGKSRRVRRGRQDSGVSDGRQGSGVRQVRQGATGRAGTVGVAGEAVDQPDRPVRDLYASVAPSSCSVTPIATSEANTLGPSGVLTTTTSRRVDSNFSKLCLPNLRVAVVR